MNLVNQEPWVMLNRLHRELDRFLDDGIAVRTPASTQAVAWAPSVDVYEEAGRFVVRADLPGVDAKDIDVTAENGVLTLRGERRAEPRAANGGYERTERTFGTFLRRFALPDNVQADAIAAKHVNGVLEISVPKQPKIEPKRITIEAA